MNVKKIDKLINKSMEKHANKNTDKASFFIRFDPYRDKDKWTVFCCNHRIRDTDNPIEVLLMHLEGKNPFR